MNLNDRESATAEVFPKIIRYLMLAILAWGTLHTIGVYVWSSEPDIRKPILVYSTVCAFLAFWAVMLWLRGRSTAFRKSANDGKSKLNKSSIK